MKKAIIVGGSMGGMLAGNMLARQGYPSTEQIRKESRNNFPLRFILQIPANWQNVFRSLASPFRESLLWP